MPAHTNKGQFATSIFGTGGLASANQVFNTASNEMFSFTQTSSVNMPVLIPQTGPKKKKMDRNEREVIRE